MSSVVIVLTGHRWERFDCAYKSAITSIRGLGSNSNSVGSSKRKGGLSKCSGSVPKRPKPSSWTHKFFCLAGTDDDKVPTTACGREVLSLAGLGEKKVQIADVDCTREDF